MKTATSMSVIDWTLWIAGRLAFGVSNCRREGIISNRNSPANSPIG